MRAYLVVAPIVLASAFLISGCSKKSSSSDKSSVGCGTTCNMGGGLTVDALPLVDLSGAKGILTLSASATGLNLLDDSVDPSKALLKLDENGGVSSALVSATSKDTSKTAKAPSIPRVKSMAVAPTGEVYIHFERPIYTNSVVSPDQPSQCQLYRIKNGVIADFTAATAGAKDIECIAPDKMVNSFDADSSGHDSVFQFDDAGNVYFQAWSANGGGGGGALYKLTRETGNLKEVISSNIWVQRYAVTKNGGVFYVGNTNTGTGNNGGYFRYVKPEGGLLPIATGFWGFRFEPIVGDTTDKAIFYGPDPRAELSSTNPWATAGVFAYDPAAGADEEDIDAKVDSVIASGGNPWDWMQLRGENFGEQSSAAWRAEYWNRCLQDNKVFPGGEVSNLSQSSDGTKVFMVGNVQLKKAGVPKCGINVNNNAAGGANGYCWSGTAVIWNTQVQCTALNGTWRANGQYNNITTDECKADFGADSSKAGAWVQCGDNNDVSTLLVQYTGLLKIERETGIITPVSIDTSEIMKRFWFIDDRIFFLSEKNGFPYLKTFNDDETVSVIASKFETYKLVKGVGGKLFYSGLDFNTNEVSFGTIDPATSNSRQPNTDVTDKVENIIVLDE